jgi:hypothetical protein
VQRFRDTFRALYPSALKSLEDDLEASLNHLRVPAVHRKYVRTTNLLERTFEEERRRTKVIPRFWTEHSALKLIFGTLDRASRRWQRPTISETEIKHMDQLREELGLEMSVERKTEQTGEITSGVAWGEAQVIFTAAHRHYRCVPPSTASAPAQAPGRAREWAAPWGQAIHVPGKDRLAPRVFLALRMSDPSPPVNPQSLPH